MSELPEHRFTGDMLYIADICGIKIAQHMVDRLPGIEVRIPREWSKNGAIAKLDKDVADILIKRFPCDTFYVPTEKGSPQTRPTAVRLHSEGKTKREIALELNVSERYIRSLLNSEPRALKKHDPRQISMFEFD